MMMDRVLITGATGFIGGRLTARLVRDGRGVAAVVRAGSDVSRLPSGVQAIEHDGDVAALTAAIAGWRPQLAFHLASLYLADHRPSDVGALVASNITFAAGLAEALTAAGVTRLVNTGTAWQHFGTSAYLPVNLYAATKQAAGDLLRFYHDAHCLSVVTLKLFDSYGPGDTRRKLIQLLVDAARSGEMLGMSPGEQVVDLTHVDDLVEAFLMAGERVLADDDPRWEEFFVGGERMTVRALAALVADVLDMPGKAQFGARPYRVREVMCPPDAAPLLPRWTPRIGLEAGIRALAGR